MTPRRSARRRANHIFRSCRRRRSSNRTFKRCIEQGFGWLKRFKRVALRCEKTAENFRSIVSFAAGPCLIKFVHTA